LVDVSSGRCKKCNDDKKKCDLRVTFKEFERLAKARQDLSEKVEVAEDALEKAENEAAEAYERVLAARAKARRLRKQLRKREKEEDDSYQRELAGIEEVERMEGNSLVPETLPEPSLDDMLASGELIDFPLDEGIDTGALQHTPLAWGQVTGFSPSSWAFLEVGGDT